jgi:hypothetical protein
MTTGHVPPDDRYVHAGDCWGEIVVTRTQRIRRRCAAILAALTAAATWAGGAPAAFAAPVPPPGTGDVGRDVPLAPAQTAILGGIHSWQAILIAMGAVLAGAVLAVLYDRVRAARQGRATAHTTRA